MHINKMASKDAAEWASAEMFFGEGAGNARKLLTAEFGHKMATIPGYDAAFHKAYSQQNFAKHAVNAAKKRKPMDRNGFVTKSTKALLRGDRRNEIVGLVAIVYFAHQMGYDQPIIDKSKQVKRKIKTKIAERKLKNGGKIL